MSVLASVQAFSARTPVGLSPMQTAMCMRARKLEPRVCALMDKRQRRVGTARVGGLGIEAYGYDRMLALASTTLGDLRSEVTEPLPLIMAVPEPGRPDDDERFGSDFIHALATRSRVPIDENGCVVIRAGHAGGALALQKAVALLGRHEQVLIGGVDSYHHPQVLAWLDEACRLHALDAEDGFVPGEAAAFCLLGRAEKRGRRASVTHVASALDPSANGTEPDTAKAMTALLHQLPTVPSWAVTDNNGERHRARACVMAQTRVLADDAVVTALPVGLGDLGAATGPVAMAVVGAMFDAECAPADSCVVLLHADHGERGVFVLEAMSPS